MALISVNGVRVNIEDTGAPAGRPDAPTVVLGHSLLFGTSMWRHQVEALRTTYRCVSVDWRGQGQTPATRDGYDMDTLYGDLVAVLEHLAVGPVHYAGLSMGGFVGIRLGARRPDLVRSLVLIDTSAGPEDPTKVGKYRLLAGLYRLVGIRLLGGVVGPIMFSKEFLATPEGQEAVERWRAELGQQDRRGVQKAIRGVTDRVPVVDELASIGAPTLVIAGTGDAAINHANAEVIARTAPNARLVTLPGVGHVSALESPERVTEEMQAFFDAH